MISDVDTARKVLDGMQALLDQAHMGKLEVLPYDHDDDLRLRMITPEFGSEFVNLWHERAQLVAAAVNGWPALIAHCRWMLKHHEPFARLCGECGNESPCPEYLSIFSLLTPYETLGEGGKQ